MEKSTTPSLMNLWRQWSCVGRAPSFSSRISSPSTPSPRSSDTAKSTSCSTMIFRWSNSVRQLRNFLFDVTHHTITVIPSPRSSDTAKSISCSTMIFRWSNSVRKLRNFLFDVTHQRITLSLSFHLHAQAIPQRVSYVQRRYSGNIVRKLRKFWIWWSSNFLTIFRGKNPLFSQF